VNDAPTPVDGWTAAHCHVLRALFATCGAAGVSSAQDGPADLAIALTSLSGQFAWHAELLFDLLPTRAGTDAEALVARHVPGADAALDVLAGLERRGEFPALCVVLARVVVPRLRTGMAAALARTDARVDGPRARALTLIARDLRDAVELLEPLAERSLSEPGAVEDATTRCAEVERALVGRGVAVGLVEAGKNARRG